MIQGEGATAMRKVFVLAATFMAGIAAAISQQEVNQRRPASPDSQVKVENIAGKVILSGWSRDEVEVTGTLGKGTEGLEFTGDKDRIQIEVKFPKGERNINVEGSDLTIHVPHGCRLSVHTISANIDLSDFEGEAELQSVSGEIGIDGSPKEVELSTVSGSITVTGKASLPAGEFKSVSGDIKVDTDLGSGGRFKFETVSGDVLLKLPRSAAADIDASTFSGGIDNDFGEQPKKNNPYLPSEELHFSIGGGGARVSVQTLSGRIQLRKS
jgi:DUF4097 and DUF4098 domain-containing protein YvlB